MERPPLIRSLILSFEAFMVAPFDVEILPALMILPVSVALAAEIFPT